MINEIEKEFQKHLDTFNSSNLKDEIKNASLMCIQTIKNGGKILICGNGGSAGDSQHFAAEITGRFRTERKGLPAIALSTDTSALTAIGNDYGFDFVFSRQVEALGKNGDLLIAISTSGNSKNAINAVKKAKEIGMKTISFGGKDGGELKNICDLSLVVNSNDTARIQEFHIFIIHTICHLIDLEFSK